MTNYNSTTTKSLFFLIKSKEIKVNDKINKRDNLTPNIIEKGWWRDLANSLPQNKEAEIIIIFFFLHKK